MPFAGLGHGAPEVVVDLLLVQPPVALAPLLGQEIGLALARVAMDAVALQAVRRIEGPFHRHMAVALFAIDDEALGEIEVLQDPFGLGPLLEQIVVLEEVVMAEGRMRDDQRLHRGGVFLHDVADARVGVDDDLVGEAAQPLPVARLVLGEVLAKAPVLVEQRHAD